MKRINIAATLTAVLLIAVTALVTRFLYGPGGMGTVSVGFIYENDESTPYTYNFALAERALKAEYGDRVNVYAFRNVLESETKEPLLELVDKGCKIIFTNGASTQVRETAERYPDVEFCQVSGENCVGTEGPANYHTFNGQVYQYQYVSGIVAGAKLRNLIDSHVLKPEQAMIGFVGNYPNPEVISAFTAFYLGARSVAPEARMRVRYTHTGSSYPREKAVAREMIDEGCIVIAQHSRTFGPAAACEEAAADRLVFHAGNHRSMMDIAPATSLVSGRVNWAPYILGAVEAVMKGKTIEKAVEGTAHGNDMSAGFARGWVEMLELNAHLVPYGTEEKVRQAVEDLGKGRNMVFKGPYTGTDPNHPEDTINLTAGYAENGDSSVPSFHYILDGITVQN